MSLPYDIIFEILIRVRVKTLFRFQCVSKSWFAMISNPAFRKAHRGRAEQNPFLVTATDGLDDLGSKIIKLQTFDKRGTLIKNFEETRISNDYYWQVKSCLDLVCIHNRDEVKFWNPATEESTMLPPLESPGHPPIKNKKKKMTLNRRMFVAMGLGYVSSADVFKVLHVFHTLDGNNGNKNCCKIFTLCVDNQWRAAPAIPSFVHAVNDYEVPFANGALHFLPIHGTEDVGIPAFDLEREEWSMIPSPPLPYSRSFYMFLCNLGEFLCALEYPGMNELQHFNLWLLKDYKKGLWVKEYSIDLSALYHNVHVDMVPLAIGQDGRILIKVSSFRSCWLYYYEPKEKNCEEIQNSDHSFRTKVYIEGFTSLGSYR